MGKQYRQRFGWHERSLLLRLRHSVVPVLCGSSMLFSTDCRLSTYDLQYSHPNTPIIQICDRPLDVPLDGRLWGYSVITKRLVTDEDEGELRSSYWVNVFFKYVEGAPLETSAESRFSRVRGTPNSPAQARAQTAGSPRARAKIRASTSIHELAGRRFLHRKQSLAKRVSHTRENSAFALNSRMDEALLLLRGGMGGTGSVARWP